MSSNLNIRLKQLVDTIRNCNSHSRIKVTTSDNQLIAQAEYAASQTATEIIAAPGTGKRIVIHYGSIRTDASSGTAYLEPSDNSFKMFQVYISVFSTFTAGSLYIPLPENTSVDLTSTQGTNNIYVFLNYTIEDC